MGEAKLYTGHNIKLLRSAFNLTQKEFGAPFGLSRSTVTSYEGGISPSFAVAASICAYFKLDLNAFTLCQANSINDLRKAYVPIDLAQEDVSTLLEKYRAASTAQQETMFTQLAQRLSKLHQELGNMQRLANPDS